MHVWDFIPAFARALTAHLKADAERWAEKGGADTWLKRTRKGQEARIYTSWAAKWEAYFNDGEPIDWLAFAGDALIAWIREKHPEIWPE